MRLLLAVCVSLSVVFNNVSAKKKPKAPKAPKPPKPLAPLKPTADAASVFKSCKGKKQALVYFQQEGGTLDSDKFKSQKLVAEFETQNTCLALADSSSKKLMYELGGELGKKSVYGVTVFPSMFALKSEGKKITWGNVSLNDLNKQGFALNALDLNNTKKITDYVKKVNLSWPKAINSLSTAPKSDDTMFIAIAALLGLGIGFVVGGQLGKGGETSSTEKSVAINKLKGKNCVLDAFGKPIKPVDENAIRKALKKGKVTATVGGKKETITKVEGGQAYYTPKIKTDARPGSSSVKTINDKDKNIKTLKYKTLDGVGAYKAIEKKAKKAPKCVPGVKYGKPERNYTATVAQGKGLKLTPKR